MVTLMIQNKDIINCLPLLASVLGRNYGVKVEIDGSQAYTDGQVIHIPSLPLNCSEELLQFARGYLDHEAAHIRYTNFNALQAAKLSDVTKFLWNCIEDWRVEKKLAEIFPGCQRNFQWLANKLFLTDTNVEEAGVNPASSIMKYVLLAVRAWSYTDLSQALNDLGLKVDQSFQGLRYQIDAVLSSCQKACQSTEDALSYAKELTEVLRQWQKPTQDQSDPLADNKQYESQDSLNQDNTQGANSADVANQSEQAHKQEAASSVSKDQHEGDSADGSNSELGSSLKAQELPAQSDLNQPKAFSSASNAEAQQPLDNPEQAIADLLASSASNLPKSISELLAIKLEHESEPKSSSGLTVAKVSPWRRCSVQPEEKEEALRASIALRSRLQGLLQAKTHKFMIYGRKGNLATKNLYRLSCGNPRVFQRPTESQGLNTAVHLLLDVSGSMSGEPIIIARQACYAVIKALSGIKDINPAVTAFPADYTDNSVVPLVRHGEALTNYLAVDASGTTPLAQALWWVMQEMIQLREDRKIILILTDGMPDCFTSASAALDTAKRIGLEVYGFGILNDAIKSLLPHTSHCIQSLTELTPTIFTLMQTTLL